MAAQYNHDKDNEHDFVAEDEAQQNKKVKVYKQFEEMKLKDELLRGVFAHSFERPSAIQSRAIVPIIQGRDVIAQAQSGTGKTATFSIGALQRIETKVRET